MSNLEHRHRLGGARAAYISGRPGDIPPAAVEARSITSEILHAARQIRQTVVTR